MNMYVFVALCVCIIALILKTKHSALIYLKQLLLPVAGILFILCLIIFSKNAVDAAVRGIKLCLDIVFPSLFPFFVASDLLNGTGFIRAAGAALEPLMRPLFNVPGCGSFAFAMGITSGYPVGAKITSGMRREKLLTKLEAERLLAFTNNSGPLFIVGAVAVGMFKMPELGIFLLACHIAACITVGILFRFYSGKGLPVGNKRQLPVKGRRQPYNIMPKIRNELKRNINASKSFGTVFGEAIKNSVMTLLSIGGFVILFSVIIELLLKTGFISCISGLFYSILSPLGISKEIIASVLSGFFEITTGTNMISKTPNIPLVQQLPAASLIIGWAGLSVHSQVMSVIAETDISIKPYLLGKLLQGIFAAVYTSIGIKISGSLFIPSEPAFSHTAGIEFAKWYEQLFSSFRYLGVMLLLLSITAFAASALRRLKPHRRQHKQHQPY